MKLADKRYINLFGTIVPIKELNGAFATESVDGYWHGKLYEIHVNKKSSNEFTEELIWHEIMEAFNEIRVCNLNHDQITMLGNFLAEFNRENSDA